MRASSVLFQTGARGQFSYESFSRRERVWSYSQCLETLLSVTAGGGGRSEGSGERVQLASGGLGTGCCLTSCSAPTTQSHSPQVSTVLRQEDSPVSRPRATAAPAAGACPWRSPQLGEVPVDSAGSLLGSGVFALKSGPEQGRVHRPALRCLFLTNITTRPAQGTGMVS